MRGGTYLRWSRGEWVTVPAVGGPLPGLPGERYFSMPLTVVAGPFLGLLYFVFIPLVGLLLGGWLMVRALAAKAARVALPGRKSGHDTTPV